MKAILIDTINRQVREVELPKGDNKAIYALLGEGTELMEGAVRFDNNDIIMVDEEGHFNPKTGCFTFDGSHPFMGSGLVLGGTDEGGSADVKATVAEIRAKVAFGLLLPKDLF